MSNNINCPDKLQNRVIALAGVFQAAALVKELAYTGDAPHSYFTASVHSILALEPENTLAVYGNIGGIGLGLMHLKNFFNRRKETLDAEITRYLLSLLHLEHKLAQNKKMLNLLRQRLARVAKQSEFFTSTHKTIISNLAEIYGETLSTFKHRVQITGKVALLKNPEIMAKLRTMLLAGIRSAVLWRQLGGNRWQIFLSQRKILTTAEKLHQQALRTPLPFTADT